jgi:hypothetical protein
MAQAGRGSQLPHPVTKARALRDSGDAWGDMPGDVAQLVEHLLCKQGVVGSSPIVSTKKPR